ncbi:MAG: hypothetical protein HQK51_14745 [Oligoflexia bacterium]|nr:hypothetical protein [Oligoflexia bacterium]
MKINFIIKTKITVLISIVFIFSVSLFLSALFSTLSYSQNERFIRNMIADKLREKKTFTKKTLYKWVANSSFYQIDLTEDRINEYIQISKKDAEDWFNIFNSKRVPILELKLNRIGRESFVYKVRLFKLSSKSVALIVYHYQGFLKDINFLGKTKIYFITIDNKDLSTINYYEGPTIWEEKEDYPNIYTQRFYKVTTEDLNSDGIKEIIVHHGRISKIFVYLGNGRWIQP